MATEDGGDELAQVRTARGPVRLRRARSADVAVLVALLAEDSMHPGVDTDPEDLTPYRTAFAAIDADPAHLLVVAEREGEVVGVMQLTLLPGLARGGASRLQVEGVRVRSDERGSGLGSAMIRWSVTEAGRRGARLVQLTSHRDRTDAHRFYRRLGFAESHVGFKLDLPGGP